MQSLNVSQSARVLYRIERLNADGSFTEVRPFKSNLILNVGLDQFAAHFIPKLIDNLALGTGTKPVKRDSGVITFTRSGTTVTASANFFELADENRRLKFDTGEEMRIVTYTNGTTVTVDVSGALGASEGTVWYVNEVGHQTEVMRTANKVSTPGANYVSYAAGVWTVQNVFLTPAMGAAYTLKEIGWSPLSGAGQNLLGRDLIPGGGDSLTADQQYKVTVQLLVSFSPVVSTPHADLGGGWNTEGDCGIENAYIDADGFASLNPAVGPGNMVLSTSTEAIRAAKTNFGADTNGPPAGVDRGSVVCSPQAYVSGSFYRDFKATFGPNDGNATDIRSIYTTVRFGNPAWRLLLDSAQTKADTYKLEIMFRLSWGRVLVN